MNFMVNFNLFGGFNAFMMPNIFSGFNSFAMNFMNFSMPMFPMPNFNFFTPSNTLYNPISTPRATNVAPAIQTTNITSNNDHLNGKHDLNWWKSQGYDEEMGKKLAADAAAHARKDPGQCVGYVRRSLNRVYGSTIANAGAAYKFGDKLMTDPILKNKWKKIDVRGLKDSEIPEGVIVLWKPMSKGYTKGKAALYGHGAIAHNGDGYANGVVKDLSTYAEVWIPVKYA